jgi:lipid-binding SYLF domain-containing protein
MLCVDRTNGERGASLLGAGERNTSDALRSRAIVANRVHTRGRETLIFSTFTINFCNQLSQQGARKMNKLITTRLARFGATLATCFAIALVTGTLAGTAAAEGAAELESEAIAALERLYDTTPAARTLGKDAKGILVFPQVGKVGFIFAGEFGVGALLHDGEATSFYNIAEVSAGYQAGIQKFSYALFFMTDSALSYLSKSGGFALGAGPSLTVADKGFATSMTTSTARSDIYAFNYGAEGLMGGLGLKGSKITRYNPK